MLSSVDNESSLPLKKRQLRTEFTRVDELPVTHSEPVLCRHLTIASSYRSSASNLNWCKENIKCIFSSSDQSSQLTNYSGIRPAVESLWYHADDLNRSDRFFVIDPRDWTESPSFPYQSVCHSFPLKEEANSSASSNFSPTATEGSLSPPSFIECHGQKNNFHSPIKYRHETRRPKSKLFGRFECPQCHKNFVQRSSLATHLRIHTGEKPYKCDFQSCSESFSDCSTYTKHIRIHTGEKPFICPVCMRAFSQSGNMHRHLRSMHSKPT